MLSELRGSALARALPDELGENRELFERDFDGLSPSEKLQFYRHKHSWQNRLIFGDSLQVMASLLEREGMQESVQCVYIDPPYGINFSSNWQISTQKREVKEKYEDATTEPETIKAFRDTWHDGIHSYLDYWRNRFTVARKLLKASGSIFVQISDENVHLMRCLLDEVFGAKNSVVTIPFRKTGFVPSGNSINDYILWYSKDKEKLRIRDLYLRKTDNDDIPDDPMYSKIRTPSGELIKPKNDTHAEELLKKGGRWCRIDRTSSQELSSTRNVSYNYRGREIFPGNNAHWRYDPSLGMKRLEYADRLILPTNSERLSSILFWDDVPRQRLSNFWYDTQGAYDPSYVVQTSIKPIQRCLLMTTDPGDLVLDPTCGSGTTAFVAEHWGRRWITCDTSRVALALARTRLMGATYPNYKLQDPNDTSKGFHYKKVPRVSLKDIANNEQIDEIWDRYETQLKPLRAKLGDEFSEDWQEDWQIPREETSPDQSSPDQSSPDLQEYNKLRRARQAEIEKSIGEKAGSETLYDQPLTDGSRKNRVSGPFTTESLSAPLPDYSRTGDGASASTDASADEPSPADSTSDNCIASYIEQLQNAGVENTKKHLRLTFTRVERYPNRQIAAVGHFANANGDSKRAAICFGPQYASINERFIHSAAIEATKGKGYDLLLVCGAAFEADLEDKAKAYEQNDNLQVRLVKMHPDVFNPDKPIKSKKGQSHNLFMSFGEPDIVCSPKDAEGRLTVEVRGIDVYDPNKNELRSDGIDNVACWFIDTDYNNDCFFVRHAYFLGGRDPYKQLKKALNTDISEQSLELLRRTSSLSFPLPPSGKIAVKVINHYGDEVTKTFTVS